MKTVFIIYRNESSESGDGGCSFWNTVMAICETREDAEKCRNTLRKRDKECNWGLLQFHSEDSIQIKECETNKLFYDVVKMGQ